MEVHSLQCTWIIVLVVEAVHKLHPLTTLTCTFGNHKINTYWQIQRVSHSALKSRHHTTPTHVYHTYTYYTYTPVIPHAHLKVTIATDLLAL